MKTILTKFLAIGSMALLMLPACKKDGPMVTANGGKAGSLNASATILVLDKTKLNDTTSAIHFTVSQANYGYSAAVTNTLQLDAAGDNWANPTSITLGPNVLSQGFSTANFNNMLLKLNLAGGVASQVQIRVMQSISNSIKPIYSNTITLTATPFNLTSFVYVPGAYQGWNPASADSLLSATSNGIYVGEINFTGSDLNFKITTAKNWNTAYGAGSGSGTVSTSGGNLTAPGNGYYSITLNENTNTIVYKQMQWSIIGDSTPGGWSTDTDMTFNNGTQTWSVTANLTAGGNVKFRLNHDWGINLGGSGGTLSLNGANIPVAVAGTYLITLDANADTYTLTKIN